MSVLCQGNKINPRGSEKMANSFAMSCVVSCDQSFKNRPTSYLKNLRIVQRKLSDSLASSLPCLEFKDGQTSQRKQEMCLVVMEQQLLYLIYRKFANKLALSGGWTECGYLSL